MTPGWDDAAAARLRMLAREAGTQDYLVRQTGIPKATLQRILKGSDPGMQRLERLAYAVGTTSQHILGTAIPSGLAMIDIYDLEVAAGHGRAPLEEAPIGQWPVPAEWLANRIGLDARPMIVKVIGDSQEPELREGDLLVADRNQRKLRAGMHVVRLDDSLLVKRVQPEGRTVRLVSANKVYEDILIDLPTEADRFEVVGRAVVAIKLL